MRVDIISIFPEYFAPLDVSLIGKARSRGILDIRLHQLRDWTHDVHRTVDDTPYGGGPGMVMKPEPWGEALDEVLPAACALELVHAFSCARVDPLRWLPFAILVVVEPCAYGLTKLLGMGRPWYRDGADLVPPDADPLGIAFHAPDR